MEVKYCCICDNEIKKRKVNGRLTSVCMKCQKITWGYTKKEEYFVKELRDYLLEGDFYMIENILAILRSYLKRGGNKDGQ